MWKRASIFFTTNRPDADTMLFAARSATMLLTLLLGVAIAWWGKRRYGATAAFIALVFFVFDPNILAHGRYVTTDTIATLFIFLGVVTWEMWLGSRRHRDLLLAGVVLGLALTSKFSAFILLPMYVALYAVRWWKNRREYSFSVFAKGSVVMALLAGAVCADRICARSRGCWCPPRVPCALARSHNTDAARLDRRQKHLRRCDALAGRTPGFAGSLVHSGRGRRGGAQCCGTSILFARRSGQPRLVVLLPGIVRREDARGNASWRIDCHCGRVAEAAI